jgi:predicted nucleotide-binding protein
VTSPFVIYTNRLYVRHPGPGTLADVKDESSHAGMAKKKKVSQTDVPGVTLDQALRVARVIAAEYGKSPTRPLDVAAALEMSPTSGPFRQLCGASIGYGLTDGGPNAAIISLADLGRRIVAPLEDGDDLVARQLAVLVPTVERDFLKKYDGSPLPSANIAFNVLESMGVPGDRSRSVFDLIVQNAETVGFLKRIKDKTYVDLGATATGSRAAALPTGEEANETAEPDRPGEEVAEDHASESVRSNASRSTRSNAIFLGHGKNRKPLDQLTKILDEYGIPHKQAVAEPNAGRPIPTKVADTMRSCGAAILIFTADEKYFDADGDEVWLPSDNVVHELGAASVLYDNRIVIFKEAGVSLASNFSSIGYIEFEKDKLDAKGIDLFRELVSFKIVNISIGQ